MDQDNKPSFSDIPPRAPRIIIKPSIIVPESEQPTATPIVTSPSQVPKPLIDLKEAMRRQRARKSDLISSKGFGESEMCQPAYLEGRHYLVKPEAVTNSNLGALISSSYANRLYSNYGLTLDKYVKLLSSNNWACGICSRPALEAEIVVDHDHVEGKVRGLLCSRCNQGLGYFSDNIYQVAKALSYLQKYEDSSMEEDANQTNNAQRRKYLDAKIAARKKILEEAEAKYWIKKEVSKKSQVRELAILKEGSKLAHSDRRFLLG